MKRKLLLTATIFGLATAVASGAYLGTKLKKRSPSPLYSVEPGQLSYNSGGLPGIMARPILAGLSIYGLLALAGIAAPLLLVIAGAVAAQSVSTYNLIRDSISSLAWAPLGWLQSIGFLGMGLLVEMFTAGLFFSIPGARGFKFGIALLACSGFGLLLIGAFPTDIPGFPTIDGMIHGLASNTVFLILPVASLLIAPSLKKNSHWRPLFECSVAISVFAMVWIAIYRFWLPHELPWFGLYERILGVAELVWVELMAVWLLRLSLRSKMTSANSAAESVGRAIPCKSDI